MKKVLSVLVILTILVGMFVSLGAQAFAADGEAAIFAVTGEQLSAETIGLLKEHYGQGCVIDVDGLASGQSDAGYDVVFLGSDPGVSTSYVPVWPGHMTDFCATSYDTPFILIGVGASTTAEEILNAFMESGYSTEGDVHGIAVGDAAALQAVKDSNAVQVFLTHDMSDADMANAGGVKVVNVGKDDAVVGVYVDAYGALTVEGVALPTVSDPDVGPVETENQENNGENGENGDNSQSGENSENGENGGTGEPEEQITYISIEYHGGADDIRAQVEGSMPDVYDFISGSLYIFPENQYYSYPGYEFVGWKIQGDETDTLYQPQDDMTLDHDIVVVAQWAEQAAENPPAGEPSSYTITYAPGDIGGDVAQPEQIEEFEASEPITLADPASLFTIPENKTFTGWDINGESYEKGASYSASESVTATAQWATIAEVPVEFTVTYDAGEGKCDTATQTVAEGTEITQFPTCTAPEGKTFKGWKVKDTEGDEVLSSYTVTADVTLVAVYETVAVEPTAPADPGYKGDANTMLTWQKGGTDTLAISFANAKVSAVTIKADEGNLNETVDPKNYTLSDEDKTLTLSADYLNALNAGTYKLTVAFAADGETTYNPVTVTVSVSETEATPEPTTEPTTEPTATPPSSTKTTWDRANDLSITFEGKTPNGLKIRFGSDNWVDATLDKDFTVSGSTLTLKTAMVNGGSRWQKWGNGGYTFSVSFTEGDPVEISVTLEGTAPEVTPSAQPSSSAAPTPTTGGNQAPPTGDETPIGMYVGILVALIAALAVVIIVVMKRKNASGNQGKHG